MKAKLILDNGKEIEVELIEKEKYEAKREVFFKAGETMEELIRRINTITGDKKMKAKLTLDNGKEIEIELTEEQEKAIKEAMIEVKKDIEWAIKEIEGLKTETSENYPHEKMIEKEIVLGILNRLDEPEVNSQIDKLANFIMSEVEGEPSRSQSAVDTAIRIIKSYQNQETLSEYWIEICKKQQSL